MHCGQGLASEAAGALTDTALGLAGVDFVQISHETINTSSASIPERLRYAQVESARPDVTTWRVT